MLRKILAGALLASNIVAAPTASAAMANNNSFQRSINLRAFVPIVCRTTFMANPSSTQEGYTDLGTVREFCNSALGYRVVIEIVGETENAGTIYFGGQAFEVNSPEIVVTDVNGPARLDRALAYQAGDNQISSMRIRIEPKYD